MMGRSAKLYEETAKLAAELFKSKPGKRLHDVGERALLKVIQFELFVRHRSDDDNGGIRAFPPHRRKSFLSGNTAERRHHQVQSDQLVTLLDQQFERLGGMVSFTEIPAAVHHELITDDFADRRRIVDQEYFEY